MTTLRPDQSDLKNRIYRDWQQGARNVLGILSTGGGKSVIMSDIASDFYADGVNQTVIAHRNELVAQMSVHLANRGIIHNAIASDSAVSEIRAEHRDKFGKSLINPSSRTTVTSVDTLIARAEKHKQWAKQIGVWYIDEAHHTLKDNKWGKAVSMFTNARGLGVTATPLRADGKGLGDWNDGVFHTMQQGIGMRDLIDGDALSDYEIVCPESDLQTDDSKLPKSGDWSGQYLKKAAKKSHIVGDVVKSYFRYAFGRKAIIFATDIETAGDMAKDFVAHSIRAVSLSSKTPAAVRRKYIKEYRNNLLDVLINVDLFDEGFDVPACEVIIMARPTASLGKYRQMVGRALRYVKGKTALIIDMVSNVVRHGLPCKVILWSLERATKRAKKIKDPGEIELTACLDPSCAKPYEKFRTCCPYCGFIPPLPEPQKRTIEQIDGDLILLDRETLDKMRKDCELETPSDIANRVSYTAGDLAGRGAANKQIDKIKAQEDLKEVIAVWAGQERVTGFDDREIHKLFYHTLGMDVLSVLNRENTRKDYEKYQQIIRGWIK